MVNYQLMAWGDGGIADPRIAHQKFPDHIQTHLWKIAAALKTVRMYNGTFTGTANSASTYNFTIFKEMNVTACVPLPYLFLVGNFSFYNGINCTRCRLYSCINNSIEFEPGYSLTILQQRSHIWLPVNLERPWAQNPVNALVLEFFKKMLKRTKRFVGIIVAVILSLITVTTFKFNHVTTLHTQSGIALHTSLQTKHFVENWHRDSRDLWLSQTMTDTRLQTQIDVLRQTVG